jgi:hypothetical protein
MVLTWDLDQHFVTVTLLHNMTAHTHSRYILTIKALYDSNKNMVVSPRWVLYSKTDWPADRRS